MTPRERVYVGAPLRASLIAKGMIHSPSHADAAFTVPMFDQYLHRTTPDRAPRTR